MFARKFIALFLLISLVGRIAIAQDIKKPEFMYIKSGEIAKMAGYLFSPEAIAQVYTKCKADLEQKELECTADMNSLNLEIERIKEQNIIEISAKDKLIEDITSLKNKEILAREKLLEQVEDERFKNKLFIAGSFVAGILLTGTIFYIASGLVK